MLSSELRKTPLESIHSPSQPFFPSLFEKNARDFGVNNYQFIEKSTINYRGFKLSSKSSCPTCGLWLGADEYEGLSRLCDATYDSAVCESAGIRTQEDFKELGALVDRAGDPLGMVMVNMPRSTLAHTCAERLEELCASFFVSPITSNNEPTRLFTTSSSLIFPILCALPEEKLRFNPWFVRKNAQLNELTGKPSSRKQAWDHDEQGYHD